MNVEEAAEGIRILRHAADHLIQDPMEKGRMAASA